MGTKTQISITFAANPSSACSFLFRERLRPITAVALRTVAINALEALAFSLESGVLVTN
jgi:hypothetical protein